MATNFGRCIALTDDLPKRWTFATGQRVVAEAVARRWSTERGSLPYAPDYGTDARGMIGDTLTPAKLSEWAAALEREAEKDERVLACSVALTYDAASARAVISGRVTTAAGTFSLILSVDEVTAELLEVA